MQIPSSDYDSPWKQILERYFPQFMEFFFPQIHPQIDWSRSWEFLDNELQQLTRESEVGRRIVDKLIKIWRLDGEEIWVLLHLEIQGAYESGFPKRMYTYHHRIEDRFNRTVVSIGILADDRPSWKPNQHTSELWGCEIKFKFLVVKLLDYLPQWSDLEANPNPFAVVVMAHLQAQRTRQDPQGRLNGKIRLVRSLYDRGYGRDEIIDLFRFIDWVITLPEELEEQFDQVLIEIEEERRVEYITSIERRGIRKGIEQGMEQGIEQGSLRTARASLLQVLEVRFGSVPSSLREQIERSDDLPLLQAMHLEALGTDSLSAIEDAFDS